MQENIIEIWDKALKLIENEISPMGFKTYVNVMVPRLTDENTICLLSPSKYHIGICQTKYLDLIENSIKHITNKNYIITFEAKSNIPEQGVEDRADFEEIPNFLSNPQIVDTKDKVEEVKPKIEPIQQNNSNNIEENISSNLNPKYTFSNYVVGTNNRFAVAAANAVTEQPGTKYNPLYIYGGVGLGKTHLMQAIGNEIKRKNPSAKIIYTTGDVFVNELVTAMMKNTQNTHEDFRNKYRNVDLFLIDDVQFLAGKYKCQEEFFHTFNALFQSDKQIILTSEKPPKDIMDLEDRLKSRFEMGLSVDLQTPDYETRLAILRKKTESERYIIDDDVLVKVATKMDSNIRELEGVFNKLIAYSSFTNGEIPDSVVENTIESILVKNSKVLTSKLIMQVVAKFFNIKVSDLLSDKRSSNISKPRQIAMYLCRECVNLAFPKIGKDFGGKDHATVMYAYGKIKEEYANDSEIKNIIDELKKLLSIAD